MTPEEAEIVRGHFALYPIPVCPVCHNPNFNANPLQATITFESGAAGLNLGNVMPLLVVSCDRCAYVLHFAWLAIVKLHGERTNPRTGA